MDYSALRAVAALTPEEQAKSDAFERSDGNRRELEMAIATERDPAKLTVLRQAFAQTFEGAPRAPDARPTPAAPDDPFAAYDQKYSPSGALPMKTSAAASSDDPFAAYDAKYGNPQPAPPEGSDFVRGFKVATGQTMPLVKGTLGLVGATGENVFGEGGAWSGLKNWGLTGYQEGMQALKPLAKDNDELTTAYAKAKTGDFGALVDWASYGLGYSLSQLLQAGATSVAGGIAGTLTAGPAGGVAGAVGGAVEGGAVRAAAQRMLAPLVAAEIKKLAATTAGKDLSADALKRVAIANVAKTAGQTSALIGYAGAQEAGSIYPEAEEQAKKEGRKLDGADLARVWATSAGAAALEGLTDKLGLDALTGKIHLPGAGGRAARGGIGGAIGAGTEAATEGAQTFLERVGAGQSLADDDALKDYINSAGLGAIGGGPVGAISGALHAKTAQEHKEEADRQFKAASDKLATATDVGDMIAAADDMARRPNGDIQVTLPKIDQQTKLDQMLDDPAYQKAQDARLKKLQEAVDLHSSLVEAQNTQTPPVTLGDGTVSSPNTPAVEGDLVGRQDTAQLPEVQQTPLMQGRYVGPLRDQATDEARQAAGMPTAEESRTSMPSTVPTLGTSAPNSGTPIAGITAPTTPVTEAPGAPMTGLSTAREQPISASSPNKYRGNTRFADLTPMSQQQAESRLEVLQDSATRKGNDPKALQIVPHPGSPGKFAIKNMTPATTLSTEPRAPAQDATQMGPQVIDPAEAYVKLKRSENTPAARAFIQAYDAGRISRNDVLRAAAADAKRRSNTQLAAETHGFVPPDEKGKTRGEGTAREQETGRWTPPPKMGELGKKPAGKMLDEPKEEPTDTPEGEDKPEGPSQWDKKPTGPAGGASTKETEKRLANNDEPGNDELKKAWQAKDLPGALAALAKSNSPTVRRIAELAQRLTKEKTSIAEWPKNDRVRTQHMDPRGIYGFYDPVTDQLVLRPVLKRKNQAIPSKEASEWVAAHEIMHALTTRIIRDPSDAQKKIVAKLSALFDHVRRNWKGDMAYGLTNLHEFVSEGWTNPQFQAKLGQIAYGKKSAWSKFVDFVSELLGFKDNNALTELLTLSEKLTKGKRGSSSVFGGKVLAVARSHTLDELAKNDRLFRLGKSDATSLQDIASEISPGVTIKQEGKAIGGRTDYRVTFPGGEYARIMVREPNPYGPRMYGFDYVDGETSGVLHERPGDNPQAVPEDTQDVWIDASLLKGDGLGQRLYAIAANYAHNTGRIFIGDPAALSDEALRRRPEQMLSSALKFGTTDHLAPHPRQVVGDAALGVPALRWVYGDTVGNIERLIDVNLAALESRGGTGGIVFNPVSGKYTDADGNELTRQDIAELAKVGLGRSGYAGATSLARAAVLRALRDGVDVPVRGEAGTAASGASGTADELGLPGAPAGRSADARAAGGAADAGVARDGAGVREEGGAAHEPVGLLESLLRVGREHAAPTEGILYARSVAPSDAEQFGPNYRRLAGRTVAYPVAIQETGETATVTTDAQQLMRDYDGRIAAMTKLLKCLG